VKSGRGSITRPQLTGMLVVAAGRGECSTGRRSQHCVVAALMRLKSIGLRGRASEMESPHAEQWQVRSKELRAQAKQMISPEAKSLMLGVADDYEHLTQIAEAMALIRSVLASAIGESRIQDPAMLEPPGSGNAS